MVLRMGKPNGEAEWLSFQAVICTTITRTVDGEADAKEYKILSEGGYPLLRLKNDITYPS